MVVIISCSPTVVIINVTFHAEPSVAPEPGRLLNTVAEVFCFHKIPGWLPS